MTEDTTSRSPIRVAVTGIPRGYHFPRPDGNWLQKTHKERILAISSDIELVQIPAHAVKGVEGIEVLLAEGGNRVHYPGELDWADYQRFFTPSLMWVQLGSTGFSDNLTSQVLDGRVTLTNAPGLHTIPLAESVMVAMLDHAKRLKRRRINQRSHSWSRLKNDELSGRTVLIVGLGRIGSRVAHLCKAFGMRVLGTKRRVSPVENVDLVFPTSRLVHHLREADYVVLALPHTAETRYMLGEDEFRAMKSSAYLINVGRGSVIDEPAMIQALEAQCIAGAYLDAFAEEPLPQNHVLWDMENVLLVPHDSHSSPFIGDRLVDLFCDNLRRYVVGKPLRHVCDPVRGY
jgi:phosphoglycerate dehydrogenase-like enzyme